jgi:hypothetical protein
MSALPARALAFLERPVSADSEMRQPSWLLSAPEDQTWRIDAGGHSRRPVRDIRWSYHLPTGNLADDLHAVVCRHAKILFLAVAAEGRVSVPTLPGLQRALLRMVEFAALNYPQRMLVEGLLCLDIDDAVEMAVLQRDGGVQAASRFASRWATWVDSRLSRHDLETGLPGRLPHSPSDSLCESGRAALLHTLLKRDGAFDKTGRLSAAFVASALGVTAYRAGKFTRSIEVQFFRGEITAIAEGGASATPQRFNNGWLRGMFVRIGAVAHAVPELAAWELADAPRLAERLAPTLYETAGRTKSIPLKTGLQLLRACITWAVEMPTILANATEQFFQVLEASAQESRRPPVVLTGQIVKTLWPAAGERANSAELPTSLIGLVNIHVAVAFVLTAVMSCSRRGEVLDLIDSDLENRDGRNFVKVLLRKTGVFSALRSIKKPVPPIVAQMLASIQRLRNRICDLLQPGAKAPESIFFTVTRTGVVPLRDGTLSSRLEALSLRFCPHVQGGHWLLAPHQLRRFFAMTFFHHGGDENALPALSWFMGHDGIEKTWRYIKESLTGSEITEVEAALAVSAVLGDEASANVERLRQVLRNHFGQDDLWLIDEDQVEDYLLLLRRRGEFTATPRQIRTADGRRHTVMIHFQGTGR